MGPALLKSQHLEEIVKPLLIDLAPVHQDRQSDVLHYVQRGNQVVELVNQPDLPPAENSQFFIILRIYILSVQIHLSVCGYIYAADDVEQRGFAGAGSSDNCNKFPLFDSE